MIQSPQEGAALQLQRLPARHDLEADVHARQLGREPLVAFAALALLVIVDHLPDLVDIVGKSVINSNSNVGRLMRLRRSSN